MTSLSCIFLLFGCCRKSETNKLCVRQSDHPEGKSAADDLAGIIGDVASGRTPSSHSYPVIQPFETRPPAVCFTWAVLFSKHEQTKCFFSRRETHAVEEEGFLYCNCVLSFIMHLFLSRYGRHDCVHRIAPVQPVRGHRTQRQKI